MNPRGSGGLILKQALMQRSIDALDDGDARVHACSLRGQMPGRLASFHHRWALARVKLAAEAGDPPASTAGPARTLADAPEWKRLAATWREAEEVASGKRGAYPFNRKGKAKLLADHPRQHPRYDLRRDGGR